MKRLLFFIYVLSAAILAQSVSYADVVALKNGRSLEGEIQEESGNIIVIRTKIGKVKLERKVIASIEKKELPGDFYNEETAEKAQPKAEPQPRPLISADPGIPLKAEGYGEASADKFKLSVSAELKRLSNGDAVLVKYKTNLPPKTVLYLVVKSLGQELVTRKQTVKSQSFATRFGPFEEKKFAPGLYTVQVSCMISSQESEEVKKQLGKIDDIVAAAELRVGSPEGSEQVTGERRKQLIAELKELERIYNEMNAGYISQKKEFDREKWDSLSAGWKDHLKKIKDDDADYRARMIVMDYAGQENIKMMELYALQRMLLVYTEDLYKSNNLSFTIPPSPDDRKADELNKIVQELFVNMKNFIETSEKPKINSKI